MEGLAVAHWGPSIVCSGSSGEPPPKQIVVAAQLRRIVQSCAKQSRSRKRIFEKSFRQRGGGALCARLGLRRRRHLAPQRHAARCGFNGAAQRDFDGLRRNWRTAQSK
jgi:hypothetical protein